MADKKTMKYKKLIIILSISIVALMILLGSYYIPQQFDYLGTRSLLRSIESTSINWRFTSKALTTGSIAKEGYIQRNLIPGIYNNIIIGAVDDESIVSFGSYPFDRKVWADMINSYNNPQNGYSPRAILFDINFNERSPKPDSDKALIDSIKHYKDMIGQDLTFYNIDGLKADLTKDHPVISLSDKKIFLKQGSDYNSPKVQAIRRFEIHTGPIEGVQTYTKVNPMLPDIAENITFAGSMNMTSESDVDRKLPLITKMIYFINDSNGFRLTNVYYPSAVLALAVKLMQSDISNVEINPGMITIKKAHYKRRIRDFNIPVDAQYQLAVNYKSKSDSGFLYVFPLKDLNKVSIRSNAIVLIGTTAQGTIANTWVSPFEPLSSVYHLAFAIGTIMNEDFIIEIPEWINILYTVLFTVLIGLLVLKGIRSTIFAFFLSIIIPFALGFGLFQFNYQIVTFLPLIGAIIVLLFGELYMLFTEEREKRFIKTTFSKYINPNLVNILIQNPDMLQLGGQDKDATLLFSDIRSFTTLSEGMTPNELISFLNIYLSRMTDIVMETSGTLDKYIGDAVVAFWGTPVEIPNHALNACKAAVKMMEGLRIFNDEQAAKGVKPINIGVGLNSGMITVGNIGSEKKKNYTAIGDTANLAEDLQDENKTYHTNIIISEFTYSKVKDSVIVRELDMIRIKSQEKPIKIYELLDVTV